MDDFCTDSQDFFLLLLADSEVRGRVSNCPPFLTVFFFYILQKIGIIIIFLPIFQQKDITKYCLE